jgi:hypothetical protein
MSISSPWGGQRRVVERAALYAALLLAFHLSVGGLLGVPLHADEFIYIAHSRWLGEALAGSEGSVRQVSGDTLRDPPVGPYLIALSYAAAGYAAPPPAYAFAETAVGWSLDGAHLPEPGRLFFARWPMAMAFFLTVAFSAALTRRALGMGSAIAVALGLAGSAYLQLHLRRAMTEAPMMLLLVVLAWVAWRAWPALRGGSWSQALPAVALVGALCGLGIAAKHNLAVNAAALGAALVAGGKPIARGAALAGAACGVALSIFFVSTPILHTDPAGRIALMLAERRRLLAQQQAQFGGLYALDQRLAVAARRVFNHYAPLNCALNRNPAIFWDAWQGAYRAQARGQPSMLAGTPACRPLMAWVTPLALFNAGLTLWGAITAWQHRWRGGLALALWFGGVNVALAVALLPLDWDRYHMMPVFFSTWLMAIGAWQALRTAGRSLRSLVTRGR